MAKHNEIGRIGEDVAVAFLRGRGHRIIDRNYRKPYGEIDIISRERGKVYIWEVKTVSYETGESRIGDISHETYRPEDNVHRGKLKKLSRVIQAYIFSHETVGDWEFGVIAVYLHQKSKTAKVRTLKNVVIDV